jgi:L-rhamnose isomerase
MNGGSRDRARAEAKMAEQLLSHEIAFDIIDLVKAKYPRAAPRVVFDALASAVAAMIVLAAKGDAEALAGTEIVYRGLRTDVIGMLAKKRERDGQAAKTHS